VPGRLAGVALVLLGLAALREGGGVARAVLAELPGDGAAELLYEGIPPTADGLRRVTESRIAALGLAVRPMAHRDLGMVFLLEADRLGAEPEAAERARASEREFLAGIASVPTDATSWGMAPLAPLLRGDPVRAAELLRAAARLVPHAPDYAVNRVAALVADGLERDAELEAMLDRELVVAARVDPAQTARVLSARGLGEAAVARLGSVPELAVRLERALEELAAEAEEAGPAVGAR
jgi:hypothetical protein